MHTLFIIIGAILGIYGWATLLRKSRISVTLLMLFLSVAGLLGVANQMGWVLLTFNTDYFTYPLLLITGVYTFTSTFLVASGRGDAGLLIVPVKVFCMTCLLYSVSWLVFFVPKLYVTNPDLLWILIGTICFAWLGFRLGRGKKVRRFKPVYETPSYTYTRTHTYTPPKQERPNPKPVRDSKAQEYYKRLGLDYGASKDQIKSSYRKLMRKHHPDLNQQNKEAENITVQLNDAYAFLMKRG